jgi:hypothetical protein
MAPTGTQTPDANCPADATAAFSGSNVKGPGGGLTGQWAPGVQPIVAMLNQRFHVAVSTYTEHHPDGGHAVDLAVGQFGIINTAPATGASGNDQLSDIARWIAANLVDRGLAWYVGVHAAIHYHGDPPGMWKVAGSQVGVRGQTKAHDDHVHVSFPPWYGNAGGSQQSSFPPAYNFSAPAVWAVPKL